MSKNFEPSYTTKVAFEKAAQAYADKATFDMLAKLLELGFISERGFAEQLAKNNIVKIEPERMLKVKPD